MVFPSVPVYLDHPTWLQQHNPQEAGEHLQLPLGIVPPFPAVGGGGTMAIRPCSMSERARLAKLAPPEAPIKCPRCESTNTKFCYFNNYSLTQPRHFCKTCRRYWTRGGALRNVPVGGGFRRSKKSRGTRSKSPTTLEPQRTSSPMVANSSLNSQLPFIPSQHNVTEFQNEQMRLNYSGIQNSAAEFGDQWMRSYQQVPQFSCLSGRFGQPTDGGFCYQGEASEAINPANYAGGRNSDDQDASRTGLGVGFAQLSSMKHEGNQGSSLSKNGNSFCGNDQYWSGNTWTDLSGSASSATQFM